MGGHPVAHTAPWGEKGGHVTVSWVQWDTMVPVPCVDREPPHVGSNPHGLAEGRLRVVGLPLSCRVNLAEVYDSPWLPRFLPYYVRTTAPCSRGIAGDSLEHPEGDVLLEFLAYLVEPVGRNRGWFVNRNRLRPWFEEKA